MLVLLKKLIYMKEQPKLIPNSITLDRLGPDIQVQVRCSLRAKRISIKVNHNGAELILPNKHSEVGYKFLLSKEFWVRKKLQNVIKEEPIDYKTIPIFGKIYSLQYIEANYCKVVINQESIEIYSNFLQDKSIFVQFLKDKLLLEVTKLVDFFAIKHNLSFGKIRIMNNKNKWGSCSSKGVLSFNWRLVFAPKEILEYLVVHEMCHMIEMNHSMRFWNLVEKLYPDYKVAKLWLKQNGVRLHQYLS